MNRIKIMASALFMIIILTPQITFASWWNPFSWFSKTNTKSTIQTINTNLEIANNISNNDVSAIQKSTDKTVINSLFQIQIWDNDFNKYISSGSGISIGGSGAILTNYHVVSDVISNSTRYKAYACETVSLNKLSNCKYSLSKIDTVQKLLGNKKLSPKYNQQFDLALLYIDKVKINNKWNSILDTPLDSLGFNVIDLSSYIKNIGDLNVDDYIYSIGYPDYGHEKTILAEGYIKGIYRDPQSGQELILNSINISHGNSGGPIFNSSGKLIGMTVACLSASQENEACKKYSGLFIPLPVINWWYTTQTKSEISTWNGKKFYTLKDSISTDVMGGALCLLRKNAYYNPNISKDECTCKDGYLKESSGDCTNKQSSYTQDNIRYGKNPNSEAENKALLMLEGFLNSKGSPSAESVPPNPDKIKNDQTCVNNYGPNRVWDGNKSSVSCACKAGTLYFPNEFVPSTRWTGACVDPATITRQYVCGNGCEYK